MKKLLVILTAFSLTSSTSSVLASCEKTPLDIGGNDENGSSFSNVDKEVVANLDNGFAVRNYLISLGYDPKDVDVDVIAEDQVKVRPVINSELATKEQPQTFAIKKQKDLLKIINDRGISTIPKLQGDTDLEVINKYRGFLEYYLGIVLPETSYDVVVDLTNNLVKLIDLADSNNEVDFNVTTTTYSSLYENLDNIGLIYLPANFIDQYQSGVNDPSGPDGNSKTILVTYIMEYFGDRAKIFNSIKPELLKIMAQAVINQVTTGIITLNLSFDTINKTGNMILTVDDSTGTLLSPGENQSGALSINFSYTNDKNKYFDVYDKVLSDNSFVKSDTVDETLPLSLSYFSEQFNYDDTKLTFLNTDTEEQMREKFITKINEELGYGIQVDGYLYDEIWISDARIPTDNGNDSIQVDPNYKIVAFKIGSREFYNNDSRAAQTMTSADNNDPKEVYPSFCFKVAVK